METVRVYRIEDDSGHGPVSKEKVATSRHAPEILSLLRDLRAPPWLRALVGRESPASAMTRRQDWAFGTIRLADIRDYRRSWVGKGCALSVYDVPRPLIVEGDSEVLFWRGDLKAPGRKHPSGLVPILVSRVSEADLERQLENER